MAIGLAIWVFILLAPALALASTISTSGTTTLGKGYTPASARRSADGGPVVL